MWLTELVSLREGQGLRVKVLDVEDVYDEFSYGMATPQAIKDFLAFAYDHWTEPAPHYVLLMGDGTYDYSDEVVKSPKMSLQWFRRLYSRIAWPIKISPMSLCRWCA